MRRTSSRKVTVSATAAIVAMTMVAVPTASFATDEADTRTPGPPIAVDTIAHRGAAAMAPENTAAGFAFARDSRAQMFELDVQLSADGVPVLMHDTTLTRTTNVADVFPDRDSYTVGEFTWAELQQLDAGSWFHEDFAGEPIPRLEDAIAYARNGVGIDIELKSPDRSPGLEEVVAGVLADDPRWHALNKRGALIVTSFDIDSLQTFHDMRPDVPIGGLGAVPDDATLDDYATWMTSWITNYRSLSAIDAERVHDAGLELGVYTVDSVEHMRQMIDLGVDAIVTDVPHVLQRLKFGFDPLPDARGLVVESVVADALGADCQDEVGEHLVLRNTSSEPIDVSGWFLLDAASNRLELGDSVVPAGATLRVYVCDGENSDGVFYNDLGRNVLNNAGDSLSVFTADRTLVELYAYYRCTEPGTACP